MFIRALKAAVPVAVKQPIKDLVARHARPRDPAFAGDYPSFAAALADCGTAGGYEAAPVLDYYARSYATLAEDTMAPGSFRRLVPVMAALALCPAPIARVVDFGGGYGEYYHRLRHLKPGFDPVWDIIETPAVCSIANKLGASSRKRFFPNLAALPSGSVSITIASGVLQYLEDPVTALRELFGVGAPYVLLSRLPVAPALAAHRIVVQRPNLIAAAFPVWFFSRSIFDELAPHGRVLFDFTIPEDVVGLDGAKFCYSGCVVAARGRALND